MKRIITLCMTILLILNMPGTKTFALNADSIPNAVYTVNADQQFTKEHKNDYSFDWLQITAPTNGIMTINFNRQTQENVDTSSCIVSLYKNKDGEIISTDIDEKLAVKKGDVYWIQVFVSDAEYSVSYTVKQQKVFSKATSKKKAPTLKKNKFVQGIIYNSDGVKTATWYKIKITKKTNVKVRLKYKGIGDDYNLFLYNKSGKKIATSDDQKLIKKKIKKGTYYIKIGKTKPFEDGNVIWTGGTYTLKWN